MAGAVLVLALTVAAVYPLMPDIPTWDQWSMIPVFEAHYAGRPVLPLLLAPYAGHMNFLPRAIFLGLGLLSHWNVRLEALLSFVFAGATLAFILRMIAETRRELLLISGAIALLALNLSQFENFVSGYPMGQVLSQLAGTACIFFLTREDLRARRIVAAAGCALVATFSWGAGFAAWPVGAAILLIRRRMHPLTGLWAVACIGLGVMVRGRAGPIPLDWKVAPTFFFALLGSPVPDHPFPAAHEAARGGQILLAAFAVLLALAWRQGERLALLAWSSYAGLALASAAMITLGRSVFGGELAVASHYATATYPLAVAATVLLGGLVLGPKGTPSASRFRLLGLLALGLGVSLFSIRESRAVVLTVRSWQPTVLASRQRLIDGTASDADIRRAMHPDVDLVRHGVEVLREHRLACFAER